MLNILIIKTNATANIAHCKVFAISIECRPRPQDKTKETARPQHPLRARGSRQPRRIDKTRSCAVQ